MRIGRLIITREHPAERALRKWGQLSPELRELIARGVRAIAKDELQEILESQDIPWKSGHVEEELLNAKETAERIADVQTRLLDQAVAARDSARSLSPLIETSRHRLGVRPGSPYTPEVELELDKEVFPE